MFSLFKERLFFVDAGKDRLETVDFEGGHRRVIVKELVRHPFSVEVFENWLYWSDWKSDQVVSHLTLLKSDKFTYATEFKSFILPYYSIPYSDHINVFLNILHFVKKSII